MLHRSNLIAAIASDGFGALTVFAPADHAFAALLAELRINGAQLLADEALATSVQTMPTHASGRHIAACFIQIARPAVPFQ